MEYFGADEPKFHCGEHVKVIDGKFKGAEGYICRIRKNSRLVVVIEGDFRLWIFKAVGGKS